MAHTTQSGLFTRRYGPSPRQGGPVAVLVHGLGLSGRYFVPLARRLAAGGATVLVPDLPGNARSRRAVRRAPEVGEAADILARWCEHSAPGPNLFVANSVGCQVVASLAARHPHLAGRLVLIGPALEPGTSGVRQFGRLVADAPREPLGLLPLAAFDYLATGLPRCAASFRHALRDAAEAFEVNLSRVRVPTLVVRGAGDTIASDAWIRRVAHLVGPEAGAATAVLPGAAHAAHFSAPDAMAALIEKFTAGGEPG
ncbi:alpha/beta hydrolase [Streptomyces sp. NPDC005562]|uniref:alpha/beta fold hydrolase n=1 Tax=Streptomyces sp. NPDC005562 TaxID=3154890 RepID=UPI0033B2AD3C